MKLTVRLRHFADTGRDDRTGDAGASAVEYSLLVVSIAAVIVALVFAIGGYTKGSYKKTCDSFTQTGVTNLSQASC